MYSWSTLEAVLFLGMLFGLTAGLLMGLVFLLVVDFVGCVNAIRRFMQRRNTPKVDKGWPSGY